MSIKAPTPTTQSTSGKRRKPTAAAHVDITTPAAARELAQAPAPVSRTRRALIDAGIRLLSHGGLDAASIDDIVREAEVAKGSFYNHFADREVLVDEVVSTLMQQLQAAIAQAQQGTDDPASLLVRGLLASFRFGMQNQLGARVMLHLTPGAAAPGLRKNLALAGQLQDGIDRKVFKLDRLDAAIVLVLGLSDLGLARLLDLRDEFAQARQVMRDICLVMLRALGADARRVERLVDEALVEVIDAPRETARPASRSPRRGKQR